MQIFITHSGFHGYSYASLYVKGSPGDAVKLSKPQVRKLSKMACGIYDCKCGESPIQYDPDAPIAEFADGIYLTIPIDGKHIMIKGHYPS